MGRRVREDGGTPGSGALSKEEENPEVSVEMCKV